MLTRIDKVLLALNLVTSRTKAHDLLKAKSIKFKGELITKPSVKIPDDSAPEDFTITQEDPFVGRGGHKIEAAIKNFNTIVESKVVVDVGACTGGFTDYVLKNKAEHVYAIDVGHHQLAKTLIEDSRVTNLPGINIRFGVDDLFEKCDLAVVDLSFISLKLVLQKIFEMVKPDGEIIALVKPQFEVGRTGLKKNGLVKSDDLRQDCLKDILTFCEQNAFFVHGVMRSVIEGKKSGNIEYFFNFKKEMNISNIDESDIDNLFSTRS